jgi:hypothetical protein
MATRTLKAGHGNGQPDVKTAWERLRFRPRIGAGGPGCGGVYMLPLDAQPAKQCRCDQHVEIALVIEARTDPAVVDRAEAMHLRCEDRLQRQVGASKLGRMP